VDLLTAVAASLWRPPGDTRPARLFREQGSLAGLAEQSMPEAGADERAEAITRAVARAEHALAAARKRGLACVPFDDPAYPPQLWQIADPPPVLWVRGRLAAFDRPAIAIVGSRHATPLALEVGRRLAAGLSSAGLVIVSGLARGVDGQSHEGALEAGGTTVAVLGCGADLVYPAEHRDLATRVAANGGVVSELPPGASPQPHHFPLRNRLIAGLSRAVVVIEAGEKSGSLITARMAMDQGRDVLAVPGNPLSGRSRGCHALIRDGARLVESVSDVLDEIGWSTRPSPAEGDTKRIPDNGLSKHMAIGETYDADTLAGLTGLNVSSLLSDLAAMEIDGLVRRVRGGWTRVAGRQC
jgi:DNA processing protein